MLLLRLILYALVIIGISVFILTNRPKKHAAEVPSTPSVLTTPAAKFPPFKDYPITAAFDGTGPKLTERQLQWIRRILASRNYGPLRANLRFANISDHQVPIAVYAGPIVTFHGPGRIDPHVIGDGCNAFYDPEIGIFAGPGDAACARTPKPIQ